MLSHVSHRPCVGLFESLFNCPEHKLIFARFLKNDTADSSAPLRAVSQRRESFEGVDILGPQSPDPGAMFSSMCGFVKDVVLVLTLGLASLSSFFWSTCVVRGGTGRARLVVEWLCEEWLCEEWLPPAEHEEPE